MNALWNSLNYVYNSSVSLFSSVSVTDTTNDYHMFPIKCNTFLQLLDTHSPGSYLNAPSHVPITLSKDLEYFFKEHPNESYIIAIQLPFTKKLIYPNDASLSPTNVQTFDDMLKKDSQNRSMIVSSHDDVYNILIRSKKLFNAMVEQNSKDFRGSFSIILRKWKDYESSRKFLVSFDKSGWKYVHKYKSPEVNLKRYKNRFDSFVDLIGVDNYINETLEVHLSRTLEFEIIKIM